MAAFAAARDFWGMLASLRSRGWIDFFDAIGHEEQQRFKCKAGGLNLVRALPDPHGVLRPSQMQIITVTGLIIIPVLPV